MTNTRSLFLALLAFVFIVGAAGLFLRAPSAHALTPLSALQAGDLIRSDSNPGVYYYGRDGFRYVFPNSKTYNTWYANFDSVKFISVADMGKIQVGGNVTYKPGVRMIKIDSRPDTYAIDSRGTLRWVKTEAVAVALYGAQWNKMIDDLPDGFFADYKMGSSISDPVDFNKVQASSVVDINSDKNLQQATVITITDSGFSPSQATVPAGTPIKFVNNGSMKHTATGSDQTWGTGTLNGGENFSRYFKTAGTFTYTCSYHPSMSGVIIVQ